MVYLPGLIAALAAFWFSLSGETSVLFIALAAISIAATLAICARLDIIDRDASPYHRIAQLVAYGAWLVVEIAKSNVAVIGAIFAPLSRLTPAMAQVEAGARSDMAKALFANSITLTPGTVTVDVDRGALLVHALHEENATPSVFDEMGRRAARAANGS
jgi:multicomponent Na+:H+ antiporter subunit E